MYMVYPNRNSELSLKYSYPVQRIFKGPVFVREYKIWTKTASSRPQSSLKSYKHGLIPTARSPSVVSQSCYNYTKLPEFSLFERVKFFIARKFYVLILPITQSVVPALSTKSHWRHASWKVVWSWNSSLQVQLPYLEHSYPDKKQPRSNGLELENMDNQCIK